MTNAHRDLAAPEHWIRSLERSRRRRELLPKGRRESNRRKHLSAALATAVVAGPVAPVAAAQVSGDLSAAVAAESPASRAIEIREGGLPLQVGSQGGLVAHVQKALHVTADGIFGPQTDAAVRAYQASAGLVVDGIVGLATWGALFEQSTASGAAVGGSNVPLEVRQRVEQELELAGEELAADGEIDGQSLPAEPPSANTGPVEGPAGTPDTTRAPVATPAPPRAQTPTSTPAPTGEACGSATIANPVRGTVTSNFGPRWGRNHDGIDIAAPTGTAVRAAACGTVSLAGSQSGYGNMICITHTSQFSTCYAHLSRFGVTNGARVTQGQVIGYVGCTGSCTGPHLHFETRVGGRAQDPRAYLGGAALPGKASTATATSTRTGATERQATVTSGTADATGGSLAPTETAEPVAEAAPVEPVPVEPVVEAAPVEPVPVEPAPVEAVSVEPVVEAAPVEPVPVEPVVEPAPVEPVVEPGPVEPPVELAPVEPVVEAAPADPAAAPAEGAAPVEVAAQGEVAVSAEVHASVVASE